MQKNQILCAAIASALLLHTSADAANLRWLGLDMNTNTQDPFNAPQHIDTIFPNPINQLASLPFGAGPNLIPLSGSVTGSSGGGSYAYTDWFINGPLDLFHMGMYHEIDGEIAANNHAGVEGVFYFYALTAGTLEITYDYGMEETGQTISAHKASERGRSKTYIYKNSKGLGDDTSTGGTETVNRDGSRTFFETVSPSDDLIALAFDFQILDAPQDTSIRAGGLSMTFTPLPVPEPGTAALLGCAALGLLVRRRRA